MNTITLTMTREQAAAVSRILQEAAADACESPDLHKAIFEVFSAFQGALMESAETGPLMVHVPAGSTLATIERHGDSVHVAFEDDYGRGFDSVYLGKL